MKGDLLKDLVGRQQLESESIIADAMLILGKTKQDVEGWNVVDRRGIEK